MVVDVEGVLDGKIYGDFYGTKGVVLSVWWWLEERWFCTYEAKLGLGKAPQPRVFSKSHLSSTPSRAHSVILFFSVLFHAAAI